VNSVSAIQGKTAIVGTAYSTPITRHAPYPIGALAVQAANAAAKDAGIDIRQIDGLCVFPNAARFGAGAIDGVDIVTAGYMARSLGLADVRWSAQVNPGSFVGSIIEAAQAVASGACTYALAWRAMHAPGGKFGRYEQQYADGVSQYLAPYGMTNYVLQYAFQYSSYLAKYGATREHLATYIVNNRANAAINPDAVFCAKPITRDDYLEARLIAYPYSILDCDMPVDVCSAVIITSADRARDLVEPAYILGYASLGTRSELHVLTTLEDFESAARQVGSVLWRSTGVGPEDIDVANIYDGFSGFIYYFLEGYGFCAQGEAYEFVQDGRIELAGQLPLNTGGGSLGMGRLHGGGQVIEGVRQIQGRCGPRQVRNPALVLVGSGNPAASHGSIVLGRNPAP
jgi:acetyl-CoA acetyltransferase